ncbi:MAG: hypothetical protein CMH57_13015 [Myxococcales bacterium]|nr:hypothetical protein [Myxococcales bacterium]
MIDPTARPWLAATAMAACLTGLAPSAASAQEEMPPSSPRTPPSPSDTIPDDQGLDRPGDSDIDERFIFGTYGRVVSGSDLRGGTGRQVRLIAHPPRLLEQPYAELDFGYLHDVTDTGAKFYTRTTLAVGSQLFHQDGQFDSAIAMRNLYLEVRDALVPGLSVWGGSRMYRGDDVYLLDFWPMDEQNTVGAGVGYQIDRDTNVRLHVGLNRLENDFQRQNITVIGDDLQTREVLLVDRQRAVGSLRGERHVTLSGDTRLKVVPYGEVHGIGSAVRQEEDLDEELLPSDFGYLLGLELGIYGYGRSSYTNLFLRYGRGLAAFDELAIPFGLDSEKKAVGAQELKIAVSSNYETSDFGLLMGGYTRYFEDADPDVYDRDDLWEVGAAVRPAWFVTRHFHLLLEGNMQYSRPNGISDETAKQEIPMAFEAAFMPSLTLDRGSYSRPQLRLIYAVTLLNDSARLTYEPEDPLRARGVRHFLGFGVEWWFNSSRG